jgi:arylsulfate sulfotransferase
MQKVRTVIARHPSILLLIAGAALGSPARAQSALSISASPSISSPAPVGTIVTWTASASGSPAGSVWYRFRSRDLGGATATCAQAPRVLALRNCIGTNFAMIRDFGPRNTLDWTASEHEGAYEVEVSARDNDTGAVATTTATFRFTSRVTGGTPAINPTANPLVFLYSAPACPAGSTMRVQFQAPDGSIQSTNSKACDGKRSMNFYVAGMRTLTPYSIQQAVEDGVQAVTGSLLMQETPDASIGMAAETVALAPSTPLVNPVILQSRFGSPAATDTQGNLLWYSQQNLSMIARPEPGGLFLGWFEGNGGPSAQIIREFDLAGTTIRETNAARVNEQLAAMGMHPIDSFHHEVRALPDGSILTMGATERILTGVQGPGAVDVIGDIIMVLDPNLQVQWAWDTFDHLDPHRMATLGETCTTGGGCPPISLAQQANDWTHGNSLELMPDGNILYSTRHQDWLVKIDYENGTGTGDIIWRLGKDGDFQVVSPDPYPWFSHQHDANISASGILTVFDNGNVRNAADPNANSRGQVMVIDEPNRVATVLVNADLGDFSMALGSAQSLPDGGYHFHLGYIAKNNTTRIVEVDPSGNLVYDMHVGEIQYRSFRMRDLYTP